MDVDISRAVTDKDIYSSLRDFCLRGPRDTTDSLNRSVLYLATKLGELGIYSRLQPVPTRVNGLYEMRFNLISRIRRGSPRYSGNSLLLTAHYDTIPGTMGADDNASGVVTLLNLASLLARRDSPSGFNVDIVFFVNEEPPHFSTREMGSYVFCRPWIEEPSLFPYALMVNIDCVGYYGLEKPEEEFDQFGFLYGVDLDPLEAQDVGYITKGGDDVAMTNAFFANWPEETRPVPILTQPESSLGHLSDCRWLYEKLPVIHLTDMALTRNHLIHSSSDKVETLDYGKMAEVVNGLGDAVLSYGK